MAIKDEVLVVGGGLAGLAAGVAAAREGADVRVISESESTLRHASGLVDVLGYPPDAGDGAAPLADPFDAIADLPDEHPYAAVGVEGVRAGLELFDDVVGDAYRGGHTDRNALVPTHGGAVKPTARYPATTAAGLASDARDALLVGFEAHTDLDAPLAAEHLAAAGVPFDARGVTVEFPGGLATDAKVTRYAHLLDENEPLAVEGRTLPARQTLAEAVKPHLEGEERVGFPAVLGQDHPSEVRADLSAALGADAFEVPMGPPSIPGMRLQDHLEAALRAAGGRVVEGVPAVDYDAGDDGSVETVYLDRNGARVPHAPDAVVLATGGLVGAGIDSDREGVREPVFGCHVPHPEERYDWFDGEAFGDHPFAGFGVRVDGDCRPLDAGGDPEYGNLFAAGGVVGGCDFAAECSGAGVSLATGRRAGERAAETTA